MRAPVALAAAAVMAGGTVALLTGCSAAAGDAQPVTPASTQSASPVPATLAPRTLQRAAAEAPLGLEVRYIDQNGRFRTIEPENFSH